MERGPKRGGKGRKKIRVEETGRKKKKKEKKEKDRKERERKKDGNMQMNEIGNREKSLEIHQKID